jgi:ATP-dependent helicase HrpA
VLKEIRFGEGDMLSVVAAHLRRIAGEAISPEMFREDKLPDSLRLNVRVTGADGEVLAAGRDMREVRQQLGVKATETLAGINDPAWHRDGLTSWDFDALPEQVRISRAGMTLVGHPMLVDRGDCASLRLAETPEKAARLGRGGLRRLFLQAAGREVRSQVAWFPDLEKLELYAMSLSGFDLRQQLAELIVDRAYMADSRWPRTRQQFDERVQIGLQRIGLAVQEVAKLIQPLLETYHQAQLALEAASNPNWRHAVADVRVQLAEMTGHRFLTETPWTWLQHYPRYFRGIVYRLERLAGGSLDRDIRHTEEIQGRWDAYRQRSAQHREADIFDLELVHYRWMLEEYRVSLIAQPLGTAVPVSAKRLDRQWQKIRAC